jgi:hypothetical protein
MVEVGGEKIMNERALTWKTKAGNQPLQRTCIFANIKKAWNIIIHVYSPGEALKCLYFSRYQLRSFGAY